MRVFCITERRYKIISINESEGNQEHPDDKFNRLDMLVENERKELFIIELQNNEEADYYLRMLYGVSKAITERMFKGDKYDKVRKVYHINILYFRMGDGKDYVYHGTNEFRGIHSNTVLELTQKQKDFFGKDEVKDLYPEYYILCVNDFDNVAKNGLDEWVYYLKNTEIPENFTARGLAEARRRLLYDNLTEQQKSAYVHYLDQTNYENNSIETSFNKGKAEGIAEERKKTALKLLEQGVSIEVISVATELSKDQIQRLISEQADDSPK